MIYRNIEDRLNNRLVISMEQPIPLLPVVSREMETIPLDFQVTDRGSFIDLFICGLPAEKLQELLYQYRPTSTGGCMVVRIRAEEMDTASGIMGRSAPLGNP